MQLSLIFLSVRVSSLFTAAARLPVDINRRWLPALKGSRGEAVCAAQGQTSAIKLQTSKTRELTRVPPPTAPATPLSCLVVYTASLKAPLYPPSPSPHILQRRFDQRRESECAPCYLAGSRPWERMIAECDPLAVVKVAPRAQGAGSYCSCSRSLDCGGSAGRSSLPLHRVGSLPDPAPAALCCTTAPAATCSPIMQHSSCWHSGPHLTVAFKYGPDASR